MDTNRQRLLASGGLLVLRVVFGAYMVSHGWMKLQMMLEGDFEKFGDPIGLGPTLSLILVVLAEVVCSVLVILGLGTRFAAVPPVIAMAVAAFVVHADDPWTLGAGASKEPAMLFLAAFLTLALTGAGRFSVDHLICARRSGKPAADAE